MNNTIVEIRDLTIAYETKPVIWDNNIDIINGSITAIVGPNGAGKSTLLKGILGLQKTISGTVRVLGKPVKEMYKEIAYIPQTSAVNWSFPTTVLDVVLMGRYVHLGWFKRPRKYDVELAEQALEHIGLKDFRKRQISQLSGGQKQRVFIARALAQDAQLYFMDEPLAGVDKLTEKVIFDFLKQGQKNGKTAVVVHHDLMTLRQNFDHIVLLNKRVIAQGKIDNTLTASNLYDTFGGEVDV